MKKLAIIGSTGSIGRQVLNVVRRYPDLFRVVALSANNNAELLARQAEEFHPELAVVADEKAYSRLKESVTCAVAAGEEGMDEAASLGSADTVVVSVVGMCGLRPLLRAVESGKNLALANKESLVAGGQLVMPLVQKKGVRLMPIDSEHSAVWQCLHAGRKRDLKRIILTASGGPFFGKKAGELACVTPEEAVRHPNWNMGAKISVDSATMMNKGLELIEARWLFDTAKVEYVLHPQSVVHSMVEFCDGAVVAQLASPDMELPIQLALTYPDRLPTNVPPADFSRPLTFLPPDEETFFLPALAREAMLRGGTLPCILNAANEAAVDLFLHRKIGFLQIQEIVRETCRTASVTDEISPELLTQTHRSVCEKLTRDYNRVSETT